MCVRRVTNTRLGPPLSFAGEAWLVRTKILHIEFALLGVVQVVGVVSAIVGPWPASAQTSSSAHAEAIFTFMADMPPSDDMRRNASYNVETVHPFQAGSATYRIYNHKHGKAKGALMLQAQAGFTEECRTKGGTIAPRESRDYALTVERLRPAALDATILICIRQDRTPLGMLITLKRTVRHPDLSRDLSDAALSLVFGGDQPYYLVSLQPPGAVFTQERLDREAAESSEAQRRQAAERERANAQELAEVERWRNTIKPGTETGCGPVLRVNGDLIEVVYYQTREPKWYRRSELWPSVCR